VSAVTVTERGGCVDSLGCLIGVIPMLVFLVCGSDTDDADALKR